MIKKFSLILLSILFLANTASAQGTYVWGGNTADWNTAGGWYSYTPPATVNPTANIPGNGDTIVVGYPAMSLAGTVTLKPSAMLNSNYLNAAISVGGDAELFITDRTDYTLDRYDFSENAYSAYHYRYYTAEALPFAIGTGVGQQGGISQTGGTVRLELGTFYLGGSPFAANDTTTLGVYNMSGGKLIMEYTSGDTYNTYENEYIDGKWHYLRNYYNTQYDNHTMLGSYGGIGMMNFSGTADAQLTKLSIGTYGGVGQMTVTGDAVVYVDQLGVGGDLTNSQYDPLLETMPGTGGTGRIYLESGSLSAGYLFLGGGGLGIVDMVGGELYSGMAFLGQGGGNAVFNQYGGDHTSEIMGVGVNLTELGGMIESGTAPNIPDHKDPNSPVSVYNQYGGTVTAMLAGAGVLANGAWIIGAEVPDGDPYAALSAQLGLPDGTLTVNIPATIDDPKVKAFAMLGGAQGVGQITLLKGEVDTAITGLGLLGGGAELNVYGGVYGKQVDGETGFQAVMDIINEGNFTADVGSVITVMGLAAGQGTLNVAGTGEYTALVNIFGLLDGKGTANVGPGGTFNSTLGLFGVLGEGTLNVAGGTVKFEEFTLAIPTETHVVSHYDEHNNWLYDETVVDKSMNIVVDGIVGAGIGGLGVDTAKLIAPLVQGLFGGDMGETLGKLEIDITASASPGVINVAAGSLSTDYMLLGGLGAEGTMNQTGGNFTANKDVYLAGTVSMPAFGELADSLIGSLEPEKDANGFYIVYNSYTGQPIDRDANGNFLDSSGNIIEKDQYGDYIYPAEGNNGSFYFSEPWFPTITYPEDFGPTKAEWNVAGGDAEVKGDVKMGVYFTLDQDEMDAINDPDNPATEIRAMNLVTTQNPADLNPDNPRAEMSAKLNIVDGKLKVDGDISVYSDADAEINIYGGKGELQVGSLNTKGYGDKIDLNFHIGEGGLSTIVVDNEADLSGENTVGMMGGFVNTTQTEYDVVTAGTLTHGESFVYTDNTPFDLQTSFIDNGGSTTVRLSWGNDVLDTVQGWDLIGIHSFGEDATQVVLRLESEDIRDENLVISFNGMTEELAPLLAEYLNAGLDGTGLMFQLYTPDSLVLSGDYFQNSLYTYFGFDLDAFNTAYGSLGADITLNNIMVPEPSSWAIMLLGTVAVLWMRRKRA